jgi:hypothetical protein
MIGAKQAGPHCVGGSGTTTSTLFSRAVDSFHPRRVPAFSRANYRRELGASCLLPVGLAVVEGSVAAVIVKQTYAGVVPDG